MTRFVGIFFLTVAMACSTGPPNLRYDGRSTVSPTPPMAVQTVVTVRNTGGETTRINTNNCGQPIRAFTTPERDGNWVWQSYDPAAVLCLAVISYVMLAPGDSYDFHDGGTIPASLPSGVYYLAININGKLIPAGQFSK
jgi:hypothetical protein